MLTLVNFKCDWAHHSHSLNIGQLLLWVVSEKHESTSFVLQINYSDQISRRLVYLGEYFINTPAGRIFFLYSSTSVIGYYRQTDRLRVLICSSTYFGMAEKNLYNMSSRTFMEEIEKSKANASHFPFQTIRRHQFKAHKATNRGDKRWSSIEQLNWADLQLRGICHLKRLRIYPISKLLIPLVQVSD